jgi:putative adenylate-forming enzyme
MDARTTVSLFAELSQLRQHDRWTRTHLEAYQAGALQALRKYVYDHSPFYRQFHHGLTGAPLHELPVLTKAMVMANFDDLVTDPAIHLADVEAHAQELHGDARFLDRYWVNATSGSTGRRGLFLFNRNEWSTVLASFARAHEYAGMEVSLKHRMKMASVASTMPWHMSARVGTSLKSWFMPALRLAATEPLDSIVRQLNEWQPDMLVSYASMARVLADEQLSGRLHIQPDLVFTSSEVLTGETRRRAEAAWGRRVFNQYAATETGSIAAECVGHHGMHLFEDLLIVEVVDKDNHPVPAGVYGDKLLVTVLFNKTQPLIRYEISDSVMIAPEPCETGRSFRMIAGVQGRLEDVLTFSAVTGGSVRVHPLAFHRLLDAVPASGWQVQQEADALTILLSGVRDDGLDASLVTSLHQALVEQNAIPPTIQVKRVEVIPQTSNGKAPLIMSHLPRE